MSTAPFSNRHKRKRTQVRATPWKDSWELEEVGRSLLLAASLLDSNTQLDDTALFNLQNALYQATMWKARSDQGRLPHSIDTTYCLAQVVWRDSQQDAPLSSIELRMSYSTALVRGVNGLADSLQQNRAYASSVASLCEHIGLPVWLVDVRHEAAHNDLPSLSVLRLCAKTFLGYLGERYWEPLIQAKWQKRQDAVELLVKYKVACKTSSSIVAVKKKKDASSSSESSSDESSQIDPVDASASTEALGTSQNRFAALFQVDDLEPVKKKPKKVQPKEDAAKEKEANKKKDKVHSPLHYARHFVRDVPIDVGHHVALSFLVWGGIGDAPAGRGVLIPGSPASFPESQEGIDNIRNRYNPLLLTICDAWPGFMHSLLVHLVDCLVSIENSHDADDAGSERKLYFLSSWIRFLVSREFHIHHDETVAMYENKDLSEIESFYWTQEERHFMEQPAPYATLLQAGLPLNSICDRLNSSSTTSQYSSTLKDMIIGILGQERVPNMCLPNVDEKPAAKMVDTSSSPEAPTNDKLSLAQMEALLSNDQAEAKNEDERKEEKSISSQVKTTWVQCQSWEPCAIGTLPGFST